MQGRGAELARVRAAVAATGDELGERLRVLVGKPGLDGHSNGAEQVAVRARDAGFEGIYQGIRLTPQQIVSAAVAEDVHLVGLSVLSGSHMELVPEVLAGMRAAGVGEVPLVVGGIIPESDAAALRAPGVAAVFTPKDFGLDAIMGELVALIVRRGGCPPRRPDRTGLRLGEAVVEQGDWPGTVPGWARPHPGSVRMPSSSVANASTLPIESLTGLRPSVRSKPKLIDWKSYAGLSLTITGLPRDTRDSHASKRSKTSRSSRPVWQPARAMSCPWLQPSTSTSSMPSSVHKTRDQKSREPTSSMPRSAS